MSGLGDLERLPTELHENYLQLVHEGRPIYIAEPLKRQHGSYCACCTDTDQEVKDRATFLSLVLVSPEFGANAQSTTYGSKTFKLEVGIWGNPECQRKYFQNIKRDLPIFLNMAERVKKLEIQLYFETFLMGDNCPVACLIRIEELIESVKLLGEQKPASLESITFTAARMVGTIPNQMSPSNPPIYIQDNSVRSLAEQFRKLTQDHQKLKKLQFHVLRLELGKEGFWDEEEATVFWGGLAKDLRQIEEAGRIKIEGIDITEKKNTQ